MAQFFVCVRKSLKKKGLSKCVLFVSEKNFYGNIMSYFLCYSYKVNAKSFCFTLFLSLSTFIMYNECIKKYQHYRHIFLFVFSFCLTFCHLLWAALSIRVCEHVIWNRSQKFSAKIFQFLANTPIKRIRVVQK